MAQTPKLKIMYFGFSDEVICDLDQAGYLFDSRDLMVLVDGQRIISYDDLAKLVVQERYQGRQYLEVALLPVIAGG